VALADFRRDPEAHPLRTRSGRIEIATPDAEHHGLPAIPSYVALPSPEASAGSLQLLTPHFKYRSNSCLAGVPALQRLERPEVWINPRDAQARGIASGACVEVYNEQGTVRVTAKVTPRIMPGVVCLYQGAWYRPAPDGVDEGGCANVLTAHRTTPSGGMSSHTTWVEVRAAVKTLDNCHRERSEAIPTSPVDDRRRTQHAPEPIDGTLTRPPSPHFTVDLARCIGCKTCAVACQDRAGLPDDLDWLRVETHEGGAYPTPTLSYRVVH
jgi:hypothetical protein